MLLMPDKKKIASIIVGGMGSDASKAKPFSAPEEKGEEEGSEMGLVYAAEKIMSALSEGKATSLVSALKEFMSMCEESSEDEGEY